MVGQEIAFSLYKTLVLLVFDYVDVVYDCLSVKDCNDLQKFQNYSMSVKPQTGFDMSSSEMHDGLGHDRLRD